MNKLISIFKEHNTKFHFVTGCFFLLAFFSKIPLERDILLFLASMSHMRVLLFSFDKKENGILSFLAWVGISLFITVLFRGIVILIQHFSFSLGENYDWLISLSPFILFAVLMGTLVGLSFVAIFRKNKKFFNFLKIINPFLFLFSLYGLLKAIFKDHPEDATILFIYVFALLLGLILNFYNRIKMKTTGEFSRSYCILTTMETLIYLQTALYNQAITKILNL